MDECSLQYAEGSLTAEEEISKDASSKRCQSEGISPYKEWLSQSKVENCRRFVGKHRGRQKYDIADIKLNGEPMLTRRVSFCALLGDISEI